MQIKETPFRWVCPFCNHATTITGNDVSSDYANLTIKNKYGVKQAHITFIVCPNPECGEFSLYANLYDGKDYGNSVVKTKHLKSWALIPESQAKILPSYIPDAIKEDYSEACLIKEYSPKASATLSRRCLQGMIRDFWGISKPRLVDEIEAIKSKIDPLTLEAIDAVRKVGNIGAHMEKDINVVVDVEPDEAGLLIELIETLINDWYISRHEREQRLKAIVKMKDDKENDRKAHP